MMDVTKSSRILIRFVLFALSFLTAINVVAQKDAPAKEAAPDVPDAIAIPAGLEPVLFVRASGSQIYACKAGEDGKFAWTLKAPDAELKDRKDKAHRPAFGRTDLEAERRQRGDGEGSGTRGFPGSRLDSMAAGERRE